MKTDIYKIIRCNRVKENELSFFSNHQYSREELVAELGSSYICGQLGITTDTSEKNSAGYIQSWLKSLQNDKKNDCVGSEPSRKSG